MAEDRGKVATPGRRVRDRLIPLAILVLFILNAGIGALAFDTARRERDDRVVQDRVERDERLDQTCTVFETQQKADVDRLRRTYEYLAELGSVQLREPLNRAILRQLPEVEREARTENAPPYCDEPDVGLPEPDPVLPRQPALPR